MLFALNHVGDRGNPSSVCLSPAGKKTAAGKRGRHAGGFSGSYRDAKSIMTKMKRLPSARVTTRRQITER